MRILSVLRPTSGTDEYPIFLEFLKYNKNFVNIDDRNFGIFHYSNQDNYFVKILLYAVRLSTRKYFNNMISQYLTSYKPTILFLFKAPLIHQSTIEYAKQLGTRVYFFYPDLDPYVLGGSYIKSLALADKLFHTKINYINKFKSINPYSSYYPPIVSRDQISDISLINEDIGVILVANYSKIKYQSILEFLSFYDSNFTLIGAGWDLSMFSGLSQVRYLGQLYGDCINSFYRQAVCCLGLLMESLDNKNQGDLLTSRSFLVPAYGGLLLHPRNLYSEDIFGKNSPCLFSNLEAAAKLSIRIRDNPSFRKRLFCEQHNTILSKANYADNFVESLINV